MSEEKSSPQNAITDAFKERLSHPVLGVFAIAWAVCNWKVLFFLAFTGSPAAYRIADAGMYCDGWSLAFWPAVATLVYVLFAPVLKAAALRWSDFVEDKEADRIYWQRLVQLRREKDIAARLTESVADTLRTQELKKAQLTDELNSLQRQITDAKTIAEDLEGLKSGEWNKLLDNRPLNRPDETERLMQLTRMMDRVAAFRPRVEKRLEQFRAERNRR